MGLTVVVVLVVLAVVAAVAFVAVQGRRRREEQQRIEAAEQRHEAEIRSASAQRREAEASERAARAEHEQAQAREQAARAHQDRDVAEARHAAADRIDPDRPDDHGRDTADPAARTDDLRMGEGRREPSTAQDAGGESIPRWQTEGGWHGPSASGGFPAVERTRRETSPSGAEPAGARHPKDRPASDTAAPTGIGDPSAPGPAVPAQRTGEHDRDEHTGPVRALADRLLRRRG